MELVQDSVDPARWHAIATNPAVREAHETLVHLAQAEPERNHYGPTTRLLNLLSIVVFDVSKDARATDDRDHAYIFCSNHDTKPHGDIVDTNIKPNYPSYIGARAELESAASDENYVHELSWCQMGSIAEQCWKRDGSPMLTSSLIALKRYRPDLPTVHGFSIHRARIQLSHVSAAGTWNSTDVELKFIEPWIAFVILVYQAYDVRDRKLVYDSQQVEFTRWDLYNSPSDLQAPVTLAPFYLRKPFGVTTFAAFQIPTHPDPKVAFYEEEVRGVWKSSWQPESLSKERGLLDRLHKGGWMPGLVRLYPDSDCERLVVPTPVDIVQLAAAQERADAEHASEVDAQLPVTGQSSHSEDPAKPTQSDAAERTSNAPAECSLSSSIYAAFLCSLSHGHGPIKHTALVREIVHLASVGEPLSQCDSPRELLEVAYDLLETHIHMWEEGILHCDLSWFNVLCKPKHFVGGDDNEKTRPCIKAVLHDLANGDAVDNGRTFKSSVLLIDLDNSICRDDLQAYAEQGLHPKIGTAGFISCELASPESKGEYRTGRDAQMWSNLFAALNVEELPHGRAALSRAFPNGDGDFMEKLRKVQTLELDSLDWPEALTKRPLHNPRHDAESIFWIFFLAFVRTRPRSSSADEHKYDHAYTRLCEALLCNEGDYGDASSRERELYSLRRNREVFHPALKAFEEVFKILAFYVSLPWYQYETIVSPDHAHIAFRRIILYYLLKLDSETLDIALNTEHPRAYTASLWYWRPPSPASEASDDSEQTGDSTRVPSPSGSAQPHASSTKRKATEPCEDDPACAKRAATGDKALPSAPGGDQEATFIAPAPRPQQDRSLVEASKKYRHDIHAHLRSAYAMRLKVWKDRQRWFMPCK
ncbi:hypothetical protein AURDEDRAFT_158119 [Auricularia subglabra TFB-10046 SS5]|nr:hypothetical protein AURDEDRAFT_158119 [Auricularia subglabra TFB-10046 SS5]